MVLQRRRFVMAHNISGIKSKWIRINEENRPEYTIDFFRQVLALEKEGYSRKQIGKYFKEELGKRSSTSISAWVHRARVLLERGDL